MEFSDKKIALIQSELKKKNVLRNCSRCNYHQMTIDKAEFQLLSYEREKIEFDITKFQFKPLLCTYCPNCGAIQLFNLNSLIGEDNALSE